MRVLNISALAMVMGLVMTLGSVADAQGRLRHTKIKRSAKTSKAIGNAMGDVRWGWTKSQVLRHHRRAIQEGYKAKIAAATDAIEEDNLRHKMNREVEKIRESYLEFDGNTTGHDAGFLRNEFSHRNGESMMKVETLTSEDYYFFHKNRLWKRYRALKASVFGDATFEEFGAALQKRYGKARVQKTALGDGAELSWFQWNDGRTTVRAIDNNPFYGLYCLVFEKNKVANKLAKVRAAKSAKTPKAASIVDMVVEDKPEADDPNVDIADRISGEIRRKPAPKTEDATK